MPTESEEKLKGILTDVNEGAAFSKVCLMRSHGGIKSAKQKRCIRFILQAVKDS